MVQIISCMKGDLSVYNNALYDNIVCSLGGATLSVMSDGEGTCLWSRIWDSVMQKRLIYVH